MATPEQNTLLALQLFDRPAQQFSDNLAARTNLAFKLAAAKKEEEARQQAAATQYSRAIELAGMQADREDARTTGYERRQAASITAAEKRQKDTDAERDRRDIEGEFDKLYPQYAAAQARAGLPIKARTEYPSTREGLGQLAADVRTAEVGFQTKREGNAADAAIAELEDKRRAVAEAKTALAALSEPSPEDLQLARSQALAGVAQAIENGTIIGAEKLKNKPEAITKGLEALRKGDENIAKDYLGESVIAAFQTGINASLQVLPNTRARLQDQRLAQQSLLALQREAANVESDLRKAAAVNPSLAEKLTAFRTGGNSGPRSGGGGGVGSLMTDPAPKSEGPATFESITPPRASQAGSAGTGTGAGPAASSTGTAGKATSVIPPATSGTSPNLFQLMGPANYGGRAAPANESVAPTKSSAPSEPGFFSKNRNNAQNKQRVLDLMGKIPDAIGTGAEAVGGAVTGFAQRLNPQNFVPGYELGVDSAYAFDPGLAAILRDRALPRTLPDMGVQPAVVAAPPSTASIFSGDSPANIAAEDRILQLAPYSLRAIQIRQKRGIPHPGNPNSAVVSGF